MPKEQKSKSGNPNWTVTKYDRKNEYIERILFVYPNDDELWRVNGPKGIRVFGMTPGANRQDAINRYKELYVHA